MKLRQTNSPAPLASWTEFHYAGEIRITNGEVETDNPTAIEVLLSRGFTPVDEVATEDDGATKPKRTAARATKEANNG